MRCERSVQSEYHLGRIYDGGNIASTRLTSNKREGFLEVGLVHEFLKVCVRDATWRQKVRDDRSSLSTVSEPWLVLSSCP